LPEEKVHQINQIYLDVLCQNGHPEMGSGFVGGQRFGQVAKNTFYEGIKA